MAPTPAPTFLFIFILIMMMTPSQSNPARIWAFEKGMQQEEHNINEMANLTWTQPFHVQSEYNVTGGNFTVPVELSSKAQTLLETPVSSHPHLIRNISGIVHGTWHVIENTTVDLDDLRIPEGYGYANPIKGMSGNIKLQYLDTVLNESIHMTRLHLDVSSDLDSEFIAAELTGFHEIESGRMYLTTNSPKFSGTALLPSLMPNEETFLTAKRFSEDRMQRVIDSNQALFRGDLPTTFSLALPQCEFISYLQVQPFLTLSQTDIEESEIELRFPIGRPIAQTPNLVISGILYSPDCNIMLEWNRATGLKTEIYYNMANNVAIYAGFLTAVQIWLLIKQMNRCSTPSSISKIAFWSVAMNSAISGYLCMVYLTISVWIENTFLPFVTTAFLAFLLVSIFSMRFLILIMRVQRPVSTFSLTTPNQPLTPQPDPESPPVVFPAPDGTLGTPPLTTITAATTTTNPIADASDGRSDVTLLYSRFYLFLLLALSLSLFASTWSTPTRHAFLNSTILLAYSFWVPQIVRNLICGSRRGLSWVFIFGMSITRLCEVAYLYCWPRNVFFMEPNYFMFAIVAAWLLFQIAVLAIQEVLGPRFLIHSELLPPTYNYFAIPPAHDLEAAMKNDTTDCAICMQPIDVSILKSAEEGGSGGTNGTSGSILHSNVLGRRVAWTPCGHMFHTPCLESVSLFESSLLNASSGLLSSFAAQYVDVLFLCCRLVFTT